MLYLLNAQPAMCEGLRRTKKVTPAVAGVTISHAHERNELVCFLRYSDTRDMLQSLSGVRLRLYNPDRDTQLVSTKPGDFFLSVLLNRSGKAREKGEILDVSDVDFYLIEIIE